MVGVKIDMLLREVGSLMLFFFFKQKTAYEMRISDWSSDVCSSDLRGECEEGEGNRRPLSGRPGAIGVAAAARSGAASGRCRDQDAKIGRASCRERVCQYV